MVVPCVPQPVHVTTMTWFFPSLELKAPERTPPVMCVAQAGSTDIGVVVARAVLACFPLMMNAQPPLMVIVPGTTGTFGPQGDDGE